MDIDLAASSFRDGDEDSFRFLVETLSSRLAATAYRYTRDWDEAGDLCQDTWLAVYEKIGRYDPSRPFRNWLMTIHRNICVDYLRRARRTVRLDPVMRDPGPSERVGGNDPSSLLEEREFAVRLRLAASRLTDRQRKVFACVDVERRTPLEASRILGMNPSTLRATLHKARKKLARILKRTEEPQ